ncbi:MAG: hypothetical protein HYS13_20805 [Planctomycetia bacterium]|nr:hypothetical protein [Planctomycetia bacterium]
MVAKARLPRTPDPEPLREARLAVARMLLAEPASPPPGPRGTWRKHVAAWLLVGWMTAVASFYLLRVLEWVRG